MKQQQQQIINLQNVFFIILIIFLFFINNINCLNNNNNDDKNLNNIINQFNYQINNNNNLKLWVFFNTKIDNNLDKYEINNKSIKRRMKLLNNEIIDDSDLPVSQKFINQIINCNNTNIKFGYKSNWLNSISITILQSNGDDSKASLDDIENIARCIVSKPFVKKIDLVSKLIKHKNVNSSNSNDSSSSINTRNDTTFYGKSYEGIKQIDLDKLIEKGLDGSGVKILIIDDGFYKNHECFKQLKIIGEMNFDDSNKSNDTSVNENDVGNDHGTATLSLLACYSPGKMIGAAYNASYLLAKITIYDDVDNFIEEDQWISALEWGERMGADLVSSSLSYLLSFNYSYAGLDGKTSYTTVATNLAASKGLLMVNSMGNNDYSIWGAPNDGEHVISVGAVDRKRNLAYFSSIGPTADGRIKPDTMALGLDVYVASIKGNLNYTTMSGTSFSCPLIASAIALLMQAKPKWSATQVHEAVINSCEWSIYPHYYMGYGILNSSRLLSYEPIPMINYCSPCTSNHGLCCNTSGNTKEYCKCPLAYYGRYCQYKRIECGYRCKYDFFGETICQQNKFGLSFKCIHSNQNDTLINNYDPYEIPLNCSIDYNDNNNNSTSLNQIKYYQNNSNQLLLFKSNQFFIILLIIIINYILLI